jgi:uncharacterized membrane protein
VFIIYLILYLQKANIGRLNATIQPILQRPTIKRKVGYIIAEDADAETETDGDAEMIDARQRVLNMRINEPADNVL